MNPDPRPIKGATPGVWMLAVLAVSIATYLGAALWLLLLA